MPENEDQEDAVDNGAPGADGAPKKKKKLMLIIGAAVVLVVVALGAFMFLSGGSPEEESPPPTNTVESSDGDKDKGADGDKDKGADGGKDKGADGGKETSTSEAEEKSEKTEITFGATFTFKPLHLNLGNPLENRFIRLELSLEYKGGKEQLQEIQSRLPQLRDAAIAVISRKTREFLLGPDGKDQLRKEILNRINQYMDTPIRQIYITDILIE